MKQSEQTVGLPAAAWRRALVASVLATALVAGLVGPAGAEIVIRKDGRKIEGQIVSEDDTYYTIRAAFGTFRIRKTDVVSIEGRRAGSEAERLGREALASGDLDLAREKFRAALKETTQPDDRKAIDKLIVDVTAQIQAREEKRFSAQLATADNLIAEQRFADGLIELEKLLRKNPDPSPAAPLIRKRMGQAHMAEAAYYEDQINYSEAADAYRRAIGFMPDDPDPYLLMGALVKKRGGKMADIVDYYSKGIERALKTRQESELLDEYYELGNAHLREAAKNPDKSQDLLMEGIRCLLIVLRNAANRYPFVSLKLEEGFELLGKTDYDTDAMIKVLQSSLEVNPEAQKARWILAEVYSKTREYDKVTSQLLIIERQAKERGTPIMEELYYRLGLTYLARRPADHDAALDAFEDEIRLNKRNYMALIEAAKLHSIKGTYADALKYCTDAIKQVKERPEAYWISGDVYMRRGRSGDMHQAELTLKRALILKPDFQQARVKLAEIQIMQQRKADKPDYTAAVALLDEVIVGIDEIDKSERSDTDRKVKAEALLWKAEIEKDRRNKNQAATWVDDALEEYPNFPRAYRIRGEIEVLRGNYDEAKQNYLNAITLDPRTPETYMLLGMLLQNPDYLNQPQEAIKYYNEYLDHEGTEKVTVKRWIDECIRASGGSTGPSDAGTTTSVLLPTP